MELFKDAIIVASTFICLFALLFVYLHNQGDDDSDNETVATVDTEESYSSSEEEESESEEDDPDTPVVVSKTNPDDWVLLKEGSRRKNIPTIKPIPYSPRLGETNLFDVLLTPAELKKVKDDFGDIRYEKVHDFLLPMIDGEHFYDWLAARMRNYMLYIIRHQGYHPRYYKPEEDKVILGHHVAQYFGIETCRMLRGFPSIEETWSSCEPLFHIGVCTESMLLGAMYDLNRCMHFTDDWEEDDGIIWEDVYLDKKVRNLFLFNLAFLCF